VQPCTNATVGGLLDTRQGYRRDVCQWRWFAASDPAVCGGGLSEPARMLWDTPARDSGVQASVSAHHSEQTPGPVRVQLALRLVVEHGPGGFAIADPFTGQREYRAGNGETV